MMLAFLLALGTIGDSAWKTLFFQVLQAGFIIWESLGEILQGESQWLGDVLFDFHNIESLAESLT